MLCVQAAVYSVFTKMLDNQMAISHFPRVVAVGHMETVLTELNEIRSLE